MPKKTPESCNAVKHSGDRFKKHVVDTGYGQRLNRDINIVILILTLHHLIKHSDIMMASACKYRDGLHRYSHSHTSKKSPILTDVFI